MPMKHPPHVGGAIRREVIEPHDLTVTQAARALGVGRQVDEAFLLRQLSGRETLESIRFSYSQIAVLVAHETHRVILRIPQARPVRTRHALSKVVHMASTPTCGMNDIGI